MVLLSLIPGCASGPGPVMSDRTRNVPATDRPQPGAAVPDSREYSNPPPEQRPGLATVWGEARNSPISHTVFKRGDRSTPEVLGQLYYDDRPGLEALFARGWGAPIPTNAPVDFGRRLSLGVRGEDGRWLPTWRQGGRTFVEGRAGERYSLFLCNRSYVRREIVVSVDGLDVMDGESASLRKRGYILNPGEEFSLEGFRTGRDSVAAFRFGSVADSYSAQRHGTTRNVGTIGVAVFAEADPDADSRSEANAFPGRWALPPGR